MAVATFDTLIFANTLISAGVPEKQAEAQPNALAELFQQNLKELATKDDLKIVTDQIRSELRDVEQKLKSDIRDVEQSLKSDFGIQFERLRGESTLIRWMVGVGLLGTIGIFIRLFFFRGAL